MNPWWVISAASVVAILVVYQQAKAWGFRWWVVWLVSSIPYISGSRGSHKWKKNMWEGWNLTYDFCLILVAKRRVDDLITEYAVFLTKDGVCHRILYSSVLRGRVEEGRSPLAYYCWQLTEGEMPQIKWPWLFGVWRKRREYEVAECCDRLMEIAGLSTDHGHGEWWIETGEGSYLLVEKQGWCALFGPGKTWVGAATKDGSHGDVWVASLLRKVAAGQPTYAKSL